MHVHLPQFQSNPAGKGNAPWQICEIPDMNILISIRAFQLRILAVETYCVFAIGTQIARFMGPTWGPPGSCRPQMGPMLAPWTLLSGKYCSYLHCFGIQIIISCGDSYIFAHVYIFKMGCLKMLLHIYYRFIIENYLLLHCTCYISYVRCSPGYIHIYIQ